MAFSVFPTPSVGVRIFSVAKIFTFSPLSLCFLCARKKQNFQVFLLKDNINILDTKLNVLGTFESAPEENMKYLRYICDLSRKLLKITRFYCVY
jgi:hypothetical protein